MPRDSLELLLAHLAERGQHADVAFLRAAEARGLRALSAALADVAWMTPLGERNRTRDLALAAHFAIPSSARHTAGFLSAEEVSGTRARADLDVPIPYALTSKGAGSDVA